MIPLAQRIIDVAFFPKVVGYGFCGFRHDGVVTRKSHRRPPTLIADDFFNAGADLGQPIADWQQIDLAAVTGWMRINGHEVGAGRGADILGHPLEALAWLANLRSQSGQGLPAGAFVLLGSIVQTHWVQLGDTIEIGIDGLGQVSAHFV